MKNINNYILLVDNHRRPERKRNTAGRYRVGAKTEKEAVEILRDKIKFGSIQVYYTCKPDDIKVEYKEVQKEYGAALDKSVRSAIDPITRKR